LDRFLKRLFPQPIRTRGILVESLILIVLYILLLSMLPVDSRVRALAESSAMLAASASASLLVFYAVTKMQSSIRRAWLVLGIAQLLWFGGTFFRGYLQDLLGSVSAIGIVAAGLNLAAYLLACYALFLFPITSQQAHARFRSVLDCVVSAGVVVTLGVIVLVRPLSASYDLGASLLTVSYPVADAILLIVVANLALADWMPRGSSAFLGMAWLALLLSDVARSSMAVLGGYQPGSLFGLGWICGPVLLGLGALDAADGGSEKARETRVEARHDLGVQFQRVLPIALELVLVWYVFADWRLRGEYSAFGLGMSIVLGAVLVVRLGIRAGEAALEQYWQLFNNIADPSFICDAHGNILLGNPACAALIGLPDPNALTGQSLFEIFDDVVPDTLNGALRGDRTASARLARDSTPYLLTLSPIHGDGRQALIAGVAHNLSEQKRQSDAMQRAYDELEAIHRRLEDLNAQLEQKVEERTQTLRQAYTQLEEQNRILQALDQIKTDFVSMVSHELRAPLTNLGGGVELLLKRERNASDARTLLLIQAEIRRLTRFVENILNMSAIEAGRLSLHCTKLSLSVIASEVRDTWTNLPDFARIQLDVGEDLPLVSADEQALRSVFGHLLDNALKYAPHSQVWISADLRDGGVRVGVRDFGPGIPETKRGLLFQRFQRLDVRDSQSVYGYGLGLYLSQKILRAMGSDLHFDAPEDGGARFYFCLDVAR
jgi:PAS domain S-box-containing protein